MDLHDNWRIKASGTLVAADPNTREVKPFAGAGLYHRTRAIRSEGWLRTDAAGRFSKSLTFSEYDAADAVSEFMFDEVYETLALPFRRQELKLKVDAPSATSPRRSGATYPYGAR